MRVADAAVEKGGSRKEGEQQPAKHRRWSRSSWMWVGGIAVVVSLVIALGAWRRSGEQPKTLTPAQINSTVSSLVQKGIAAAQSAPAPSTAIYQTIQPSLVLITATGRNGASDTSSGAGVVVDTQGQILTARHVVTGAQSINVTFADGTSSPAQIVTEQPTSDIAVLQTAQPPSVIVPATLGGGVQVGQDVYAVGHPYGLVDSMTAGVVSGLNRTVPVQGGPTLNGLIQFDAAVNPGNSGGPLLNRAGQVVGIVTGLANPADQAFFVGIGFAVPIATAGGAAGAPQQ
jgi:S1-C subfamily serine protease